MFADNTNICFEADTLNDMESILNKELIKLDAWTIVGRHTKYRKNKKFIIFHLYNKPLKQRITLKIHKKAIVESQSIKYLGVMLDSKEHPY